MFSPKKCIYTTLSTVVLLNFEDNILYFRGRKVSVCVQEEREGEY